MGLWGARRAGTGFGDLPLPDFDRLAGLLQEGALGPLADGLFTAFLLGLGLCPRPKDLLPLASALAAVLSRGLLLCLVAAA